MLNVPFPSNLKVKSKYSWNIYRRKFFFSIEFSAPFLQLSPSLFLALCHTLHRSLFPSFGIPGRCTLYSHIWDEGRTEGRRETRKGILVTRAVVSNYIVIQIYRERCTFTTLNTSKDASMKARRITLATKVGRHFYVYHSMPRNFKFLSITKKYPKMQRKSEFLCGSIRDAPRILPRPFDRFWKFWQFFRQSMVPCASNKEGRAKRERTIFRSISHPRHTAYISPHSTFFLILFTLEFWLIPS